jgi:hypothetical protein
MVEAVFTISPGSLGRSSLCRGTESGLWGFAGSGEGESAGLESSQQSDLTTAQRNEKNREVMVVLNLGI